MINEHSDSEADYCVPKKSYKAYNQSVLYDRSYSRKHAAEQTRYIALASTRTIFFIKCNSIVNGLFLKIICSPVPPKQNSRR